MLLDIYKQKNSGSSGQNHSGETKLTPCLDPKAQDTLTWGWGQGSLWASMCNAATGLLWTSPQSSPKETRYHWTEEGKGPSQTFQGLLGTINISHLMLTTGDSNFHNSPTECKLMEIRSYRGSLRVYPVVIFPECALVIDKLLLFPESHSGSLTHGMKPIMVVRAKEKLSPCKWNLPIPATKIVNPKKYQNPLENCTAQCNHQILKRCRSGDSDHINI